MLMIYVSKIILLNNKLLRCPKRFTSDKLSLLVWINRDYIANNHLYSKLLKINCLNKESTLSV